ncbi:hypothetical protein FACS1894172_12730 [Spirochaetia bacterium]|nr:hypothetical protein FACS1894172_12730 [Spirochaetia bacterium]
MCPLEIHDVCLTVRIVPGKRNGHRGVRTLDSNSSYHHLSIKRIVAGSGRLASKELVLVATIIFAECFQLDYSNKSDNNIFNTILPYMCLEYCPTSSYQIFILFFD